MVSRPHVEEFALEGRTSLLLLQKETKDKCVCNRSMLLFNCKALNEVDDDEQEGTVNSQSEESENELDNSLSSQSNANAGT